MFFEFVSEPWLYSFLETWTFLIQMIYRSVLFFESFLKISNHPILHHLETLQLSFMRGLFNFMILCDPLVFDLNCPKEDVFVDLLFLCDFPAELIGHLSVLLLVT